ncbi:acyl-CoA dehydrogenase family protein [Algiphilus sp. NNCM1]|jgi:alkylation response protein AidB-like acyl-CoA dehydrogenase|uniref:acyl-CoA dehydrogenase family protein n=1 Tax=Algiphilus sp. TaxID=1872431 RepID=UPI001CA63F6D|nr:acyl-CoA dehydrogenase family protein [Algiphilus sp.]MBY8964475.1 acyl-CoA dehydrogenase family protein [Algiphilus acroporae]MCI5103159.1 acyl-CoA dehydrogenase family protein [Algiphilus sp.]
MDFSYSQEQEMLRESAAKFAAKGYGFDRYQSTLQLPGHCDATMWSQMAEFGWLGLPLPEDAGGLGGSALDVSLICEALGAGMVLEPYVSGAVLPGHLLGLCAGQPDLLGRLAEGETQLAVAWAEPGSAEDPAYCATRADADGDGYVLGGRKQCVLNAPNATTLIVSARSAGGDHDPDGISLFAVDPQSDGLELKPYPLMGGGYAADIRLDQVRVGAASRVGAADAGFGPLDAALDHATVAACAQALGAMSALLERTREYLRVRKQFGTPIGSFQALQHRLVEMFVEVEQSRSMVIMSGVRVESAEPAVRRRAVSAAKAYLGQSSKFVAQQAVQLHGGIGVTEELDVGHYFRQLSAFGTLYGSREYHLRRFADNEAGAGAE